MKLIFEMPVYTYTTVLLRITNCVYSMLKNGAEHHSRDSRSNFLSTSITWGIRFFDATQCDKRFICWHFKRTGGFEYDMCTTSMGSKRRAALLLCMMKNYRLDILICICVHAVKLKHQPDSNIAQRARKNRQSSNRARTCVFFKRVLSSLSCI